jgi:hypothetical protein
MIEHLGTAEEYEAAAKYITELGPEVGVTF